MTKEAESRKMFFLKKSTLCSTLSNTSAFGTIII